MIQFTVYGKCTPKGRPRFYRKGSFVGTYTDAKTKDAEQSFMAQAIKYKPEKPLDGALIVEFNFNRVRPKSKKKDSRWTTKPDLTNFIKQAEDAMNGIFYKDDAQIVKIIAEKSYADIDWTEIIIEELE